MNDKDRLLEEITEIVRGVVKRLPDKVTPETNLVNLSMTSIDQIRLVVALEKRYNIEISQEEAASIETVGQLMEFVESKGSEFSGTRSA